jgi:hypothetical protein
MDDLIPGLSRIALLDNMENASVPATMERIETSGTCFWDSAAIVRREKA